MALLTRGRGPRSVEDSRMSLIEHLEALRRVLIVSIAAWMVATIAAFFVSNQVFQFLLVEAQLKQAFFTAPTGGVFLRLKIALYLGIVVASPIIIQQIWWFVSPGLHRHERRLAAPLIIATLLFFLVGIGFALFSLPLFIKILNALAPPNVGYFPIADELLGFILALVIAFGLVFELPVILYVLGIVGIVKSRWLYKNRAYWYIGLGLVSNLLTPGVDPVTPLILMVPLVIFWEGTALLLKLTGH